MKLTGILPARNEDWILGFTARTNLMWMDELILINHASTDSTAGICHSIQKEVGDRLTLISKSNREWMQYEYRQEALELARRRGATHIAFLDADEALTANLLGLIRPMIEALKPGECLTLPVPCMWRSPIQHRTGEFRYAHDKLTVAFADSPEIQWYAKDGYQHDQRQPYGIRQFVHRPVESGGVMHFQWADWERCKSKHALYQMQHMIRWPERQTAREIAELHAGVLDETNLNLASAPAVWFQGYEHLLDGIRKREPWQREECRRLWDQYGPEKFEGLNLFGVVG